jgi:hypothetical protein
MNHAKTTLVLAARWLIVLTISLVVLGGNVFASPASPKVSKCEASCAAKCPCCVKAADSKAPAPVAPAPSARALVKDFQLFSIVHALLAPEEAASSSVSPRLVAPHFSASSPLFLRHCAFLI